MSKAIPFHIDYIDNLGQGVSRLTDKICLLNRVLPQERGQATILAEKSKITFAEPVEFHNRSPRRINASCPHFDQCQGCHFLHTDYEYEQELKFQAYSRLFSKWIDTHHIGFVAAPKRDHYRTRIQLHYNLKNMTLGYQTKNGLLPVPHCQLPVSGLASTLDSLYHNQQWADLIPDQSPEQGHIELSIKSDGHVHLAFNEPYAHGGFTQVNRSMNRKLIGDLHAALPSGTRSILDLFGGYGNLTRDLKYQTTVVDYINAEQVAKQLQDHQRYFSLNIYAKDSPARLARQLDHRPDCLIVDPPRSGLKNLRQFVKELEPQHVFYVSCSPNTLARDIKSIESEYQICSLDFYDFFPSTHHLEAVARLTKLD